MAYRRRILAFVMAGGRGERLDPLTRYRTKPAVPFGARYRIRKSIIDKNVRLEAGEAMGYDAKSDRKRYFVSESGIVVVPKFPETRETRARKF